MTVNIDFHFVLHHLLTWYWNVLNLRFCFLKSVQLSQPTFLSKILQIFYSLSKCWLNICSISFDLAACLGSMDFSISSKSG